MKAKKLPSGSWNVQVFVGTDENGKRIRKSFTAPTKKEAEYLAASFKAHHQEVTRDSSAMTLREAIDKYIALRENILSPSTIRGYKQIQKHRFKSLMDQKLKTIDSKKIQAAVNLECRTVSEKTIHNAYGLVKSVMAEYAPDVHVDVKLPQKKKYEAQFLSPEQIKTLITSIKGDSAELGILLALWLGMRRSEIIALQWKCYDPVRKTLRITQALVPDKDEKYVLKPPKTTESERELIVPDYICRILDTIPHDNDDDYIITIAGSTIWKHLDKICDKNGLPHVRVHDLRHTAASIDLLLGTPQKYAMQRGGWSNPQTMQKIYQHTFSDAMEESAKRYNDYFQKLIDE